jgi:5-methyltetrahydropteroyltriglutamate--homocysteine methyltransferase
MKEIQPLLTTVIGSYPTSKFHGEEAIKFAVQSQIKAGIDIVSDGQTRKDMVNYFTDHIPGFIYDDERLKITDKISPPEKSPITEDLKIVRKLLNGKDNLKAIITGPVTLISSAKIEKSSTYNGFLDPKLYTDMGEALRKELELFKKVGISYIQIDEPFYSVGAPLHLGMKAIEIITENVKIPVGLHVCGNITRVIDKLVSFPGIDILSLEFAASRNNFTVIKKELFERNSKKLGVGCVNSQINRIESIQDIREIIEYAIDSVGKNNIILHPDCGLRLLEPQSAYTKLESMVRAVKQLRK